MSYTLGPLAITTTRPLIVPVGTSTTVGAVVVGNESPYAVSAQAGGSAVWALAQMANRLNCDSSAFSGNVTLIADSYLSNENEAPSFVVFLEVYAPGEPIPGSYPCSLTRMSNVGNPSSSGGAANVIEQDLLTPFVLNGLVASKDGSIANQLDVTSGVALMRQADQSLGRITPGSTTFDTSVHSTTYFLDLQTDGSYSWNTSHSTQPNYLSIAQVTTDGSGNISTVTDERTLNTTLLSSLAGAIVFSTAPHLPSLYSDGGAITSDGSGNLFVGANSSVGAAEPGGGRSVLFYDSTFHIFNIQSPQSGSNPTVTRFITWDGSAQKIPFGIGGSTAFTPAYIDNSGNLTANAISKVGGQTSVGSFGVPLIVAQALDHNITVSTLVTVLSFTPPVAGFYRVSGWVQYNSASGNLTVTAGYYNPHISSGSTAIFVEAAAPPVAFNSTAVSGPNSKPLMPVTIWAGTGSAITCNYQNTAASPSDWVSFIIERLS